MYEYGSKSKVAQKRRNPVYDGKNDGSLGEDTASNRRELSLIAQTERNNKTGLPDKLKANMEAMSGLSLDEVRVHYNSEKPAAIQALAYTQGTDIYVAPGEEKHLPHELWHTVQQSKQRVPATNTVNGMKINDDSALEHEADVMGAAAQRAVVGKTENLQKAAAGFAPAVQRQLSRRLRAVTQCHDYKEIKK